MTKPNTETIREFFDALYPDETVTPFNRCVLWAPGNFANDWCASLDELVERVAQRAETADVYFGASLQSLGGMTKEAKTRKVEPDMKTRRGYAQSASVLPGVWLDLDYGTTGHEKQNLPETEEEAMQIVEAMPSPPTIILRTGGGLHAWWLLVEPFEIETPEDMDRARRLTYGWSQIARAESTKRGWSMDSVHDLARVMRIPGTTNRKPAYGASGREVTMALCDPSVRHDIDGLEVFLPDDVPPPMNRPLVSLEEYKFDLREDARIDSELIDECCRLDAKFKQTWERKRTDLPSQSEYDLSIAGQLASMGVSDQEIVNAMVVHRRKAKLPAKLRHDYYAGRLAMVRVIQPDISASTERMAEVAVQISTGAEMPSEMRTQIKEDLTTLLGLPPGSEVLRVEKYPGDPPTFALRTAVGLITLGTVSAVTQARVFRDTVAAATGHLMTRHKAIAWDGIAQAILHSAEEVDLGPEGSIPGEVRGWLEGFMEDEQPSLGRDEGCNEKISFRHDGQIWFFLQGLRQWLRMSMDFQIEGRQLATRLRQIGSTPRTMNYAKGSKGIKSTRSVWSLPAPLAGGSKAAAPADGGGR